MMKKITSTDMELYLAENWKPPALSPHEPLD